MPEQRDDHLIEAVNGYRVVAAFAPGPRRPGRQPETIVVCDRAPEFDFDRYAVWTLEAQAGPHWGFYTDDLAAALADALARAGMADALAAALATSANTTDKDDHE